MRSNLGERRRAPRRVPGSGETLSRMRLRAGRELTVVDLSAFGACVEGHTRLLPGTHIDVHVVTRHGRALVRARVIRAMVWQLSADVVIYRAAFAFDHEVDTEVDGYGVPSAPSTSEAGEGRAYPDELSAKPATM